MRSDEVVKEIAARVKALKGLDADVVKCVVDALLTTDDPMREVEALDSQLYTLAQRRTGKKK
jgi:hypothetical protein